MILKYLLEKEFKQFLRHPFIPKMVMAFPVMLVVILPWVVTMDVKNVRVAIVDNDQTPQSRELVSKIDASQYFILTTVGHTYQDGLEAVQTHKADVLLRIPHGFSKGEAMPFIAANATDATKGQLGGNYLMQIVQSSARRSDLQSLATTVMQGNNIATFNAFNPRLNYRFFMLPALMGMLIIMLGCAIPALAIVTEKETGTIEQINVSPVNRFTFILGKLIPYWIMGLVALSLAFLFAWIIYGFRPTGSLLVLYTASLLMIMAMSGMGLLISNYSNTIQQAIFMIFFFMIIMILMSGLFTPTTSMPDWAQAFSNFLPPKHFMQIMRCVYLKGSTFRHLVPKFLWLAAFAIVLDGAAIISYRKKA